jgi:hypothetical protein
MVGLEHTVHRETASSRRFHPWQGLLRSARPFLGKPKLSADGEFLDSLALSAVVVSDRLVRAQLEGLFVEITVAAGRDIPRDPRTGQEGRFASAVLPD